MISRQAAFFILADCIDRLGGSIARIAAKARGVAPLQEGAPAGAPLAGSRTALRREVWTETEGAVELLSLDRGNTWFVVRSLPDGRTAAIEPAGTDLLEADPRDALAPEPPRSVPRPRLAVANAGVLPARPVVRAFAIVG